MKFSNNETFLRRLTALICLLWILGFISGLSIYRGPIWAAGSVILSFVVLCIFKKVLDDLDPNIKGMKGEHKVSSILSSMSSEGVRHGDNIVLRKGHGDIDHIAVARTGVWVIETKYIDGSINFRNGALEKDGVPFTKDFLHQVLRETKATREYLADAELKSIPVWSVLVFAGEYSKVRFGKKKIEDVFVIGSSWLPRLILESEPVNQLTSDQIEKIADLFRKVQSSE